MEQNRNHYFDFLRGIAILMVVGIHSFKMPEGTTNSLFFVIGRELINFAVPLFLAISGIFAMRSYRRVSYGSYLKRQIPKVYVPTIIWSIPWFILALHSGKSINYCSINLIL